MAVRSKLLGMLLLEIVVKLVFLNIGRHLSVLPIPSMFGDTMIVNVPLRLKRR
jgi:hypothetical protein